MDIKDIKELANKKAFMIKSKMSLSCIIYHKKYKIVDVMAHPILGQKDYVWSYHRDDTKLPEFYDIYTDNIYYDAHMMRIYNSPF